MPLFPLLADAAVSSVFCDVQRGQKASLVPAADAAVMDRWRVAAAWFDVCCGLVVACCTQITVWLVPGHLVEVQSAQLRLLQRRRSELV